MGRGTGGRAGPAARDHRLSLMPRVAGCRALIRTKT
jgi:hypothetical protein